MNCIYWPQCKVYLRRCLCGQCRYAPSLRVECLLWHWRRLTKFHAMKAYRGVEVLLHTFLALGLDGDEWSASLSDRFAPRERAHGTHFIGGWVGPRAILDMVAKWKIPSPLQNSNHPVCSPALYKLSYQETNKKGQNPKPGHMQYLKVGTLWEKLIQWYGHMLCMDYNRIPLTASY